MYGSEKMLNKNDMVIEMRPSKVFSERDLNDHQKYFRKLQLIRRNCPISDEGERLSNIRAQNLPSMEMKKTASCVNMILKGAGCDEMMQLRARLSLDGKWYERFYLENEENLINYRASTQMQNLIICLLELESSVSSPVPLELTVSDTLQSKGLEPEQGSAEITSVHTCQAKLCSVCDGMFSRDKTAVHESPEPQSRALQPMVLAASVTDADKDTPSPPALISPGIDTATAPATLESTVSIDCGHTGLSLIPAATQEGTKGPEYLPEPASHCKQPDWPTERSLRVPRRISGLQSGSASHRKSLISPMASSYPFAAA